MNRDSGLINTERETRYFIWFLTVVLGGMGAVVATNTPSLQQPARLALFAGLLVAHIALHWLAIRFLPRPALQIVYLLAQGGLAAALVALSGALALAAAVSMALLGEAIGIYGITRRGLLAAVFYLAVPLGAYAWVAGLPQFDAGLIGMVLMGIFVIIYVEMYSRQANANERAQELLSELEGANRQLSEYAAQVEDLTIAAERQRMARELHDTLSQGLAGLILQLEAADAHLSNGRPEKARQIVQATMQNARAALAGARQAIDNLRGGGMALAPALQAEVAQFQAGGGAACRLELGELPELPAHLVDPIVRLVQEGLANIRRHAQAGQVCVRLTVEDGALLLEISDDGAGFDLQAVPPGHYGLIGMQERARLAGGALHIESAPGRGTKLSARIPLP